MDVHATLGQSTRPRFLMCPPQHFAVTYSINPWMDPAAWADGGEVLHADAKRQWAALRRALAKEGAVIDLLDPAPGLPDLVFTANAAVVLDRKAVLARFRHGERRDEEPLFAAMFESLKARGLIDDIIRMPDNVALEGAGDCIWDPQRRLFWMGSGFRSDPAAGPILERHFGAPCVPLALASPSFYHLDTAFCALPCGAVIYYPAAFRRRRSPRSTPASRLPIASRSMPKTPRALPPTPCTSAAPLFFFKLQHKAAKRTRTARRQRRRDAAACISAQRRLGVLPDAPSQSSFPGGGRQRFRARHGRPSRLLSARRAAADKTAGLLQPFDDPDVAHGTVAERV